MAEPEAPCRDDEEEKERGNVVTELRRLEDRDGADRDGTGRRDEAQRFGQREKNRHGEGERGSPDENRLHAAHERPLVLFRPAAPCRTLLMDPMRRSS